MLDSKLLAAHQWIVDTSEKKPGWWAEQVIIPNTVVNIVSRVLRWEPDGWSSAMLVLTILVGALLVVAARNEAMLKTLGTGVWFRVFLVGITLYSIVLMILKPSGIHGLDIVATALATMYYYFAACENPRPKKRKEKKLVLRTT